jgi:soluble lytic murein transglycosylase
MHLSGWAKFHAGCSTGLVLAMTLAVAAAGQTSGAPNHAAKTPQKSTGTKGSARKSAPAKSASAKAAPHRKTAKGKPVVVHHHHVVSKPTAKSIRLTQAFTASAQLRPMAQQLAATRAPAAYAGVLNYAANHPGEGAAAAYLAVGHAYMLDRRFPEAAAMFQRAAASGIALDDYATYLGAQAWLQAGRGAEAYPLLDHFAERYPDSIFAVTAPILLANTYLQTGDTANALRILTPLKDTAIAAHVDFRYALARAAQLSGNTTEAAAIFRRIYLQQPLSGEAGQARQPPTPTSSSTPSATPRPAKSTTTSPATEPASATPTATPSRSTPPSATSDSSTSAAGTSRSFLQAPTTAPRSSSTCSPRSPAARTTAPATTPSSPR